MAKANRPTARDGAIIHALRIKQFGEHSTAQMAEILSNLSGYAVYREHINAYESGTRAIPDKINEAAARAFDVDVTIFPDYMARHFTAEEAANPLVAWARAHAKTIPIEEAREFVALQEGGKSDLYPPVVRRLLNDGLLAVELPRLRTHKRKEVAA